MHQAKVAKLVDAPGLGPGAARCGGSSPPLRIFKQKNAFLVEKRSLKSVLNWWVKSLFFSSGCALFWMLYYELGTIRSIHLRRYLA